MGTSEFSGKPDEMQGVTCDELASRASRFVFWKLGKALAGWATWLEYRQILLLLLLFFFNKARLPSPPVCFALETHVLLGHFYYGVGFPTQSRFVICCFHRDDRRLDNELQTGSTDLCAL